MASSSSSSSVPVKLNAIAPSLKYLDKAGIDISNANIVKYTSLETMFDDFDQFPKRETEIGQGGNGTVYKTIWSAHQAEFVALKLTTFKTRVDVVTTYDKIPENLVNDTQFFDQEAATNWYKKYTNEFDNSSRNAVNEIETLSNFAHPNINRLYAYCINKLAQSDMKFSTVETTSSRHDKVFIWPQNPKLDKYVTAIAYEFGNKGSLMACIENTQKAIMRHVAGKDPIDMLKKSYLSLPYRVLVLRDVAFALFYLQTHHPTNVYLHNDVKPENVLISSTLDTKNHITEFKAMLGDFGGASVIKYSTPWIREIPIDETGAGAKSLTYTPGYVHESRVSRPPDHRPIDRKIDVYAFGRMIMDLLIKDGAMSKDVKWDSNLDLIVYELEGINDNQGLVAVYHHVAGKLANMSRRCTRENIDYRPEPGEIVAQLEHLFRLFLPQYNTNTHPTFANSLANETKFGPRNHQIVQNRSLRRDEYAKDRRAANDPKRPCNIVQKSPTRDIRDLNGQPSPSPRVLGGLFDPFKRV